MVRVFFSAVVAAASSSQYDGGFSRQWAGEVDGVHREKHRLTAALSNGRKGKDGNFRQSTRIGNDPEVAPRDGRLASPMNEEKKMTISIGSFLETWRGKVMLVCVTDQVRTLAHWCHPGKKTDRTALNQTWTGPENETDQFNFTHVLLRVTITLLTPLHLHHYHHT